MRWLRVVLVALPGLGLAVAGTLHPAGLGPDTAHMWWTMHVWLVPVFPLLGLVQVWLVRGAGQDPLAWVARVGAYVFACFYTALDVLAGIGAGRAVELEPQGSPSAVALLGIGDALGSVGAWANLVAAVATGVVVLRLAGVRALPGAAVLVAAAVPFLHSHIFWPVGVASMAGMALGAALLEIALTGGVSHATLGRVRTDPA